MRSALRASVIGAALLLARPAHADSAAEEPAPVAPAEPAPETAPAPPVVGPPAFDAPAPSDSPVGLKIYGDTLFRVQNHGAVKTTFEAAHIDLFFTADVGKLSFLSEVFFEARDANEIAVDVERLQVSYLFENWLRVRAGRSHTAFGYYNDTYHHGNLFELTTERPYGIAFEDDGGLFTAHLVGAGLDGTIDGGGAGSLRYDVEVGNGHLADTRAVAVVQAGKTEKMANLRLRWLTPLDGLMFGINGMYDIIPELEPVSTDPGRRKVMEAVGGAHLVYIEHGVHLLVESYAIHHVRSGGGTFDSFGGFAELGYSFGKITPYVRPEYIRFPKDGDPVFQHQSSFWAGAPEAFDARVGVRWLAMPQLAIKLEGERFAHGSGPQELVTTKLAFGF